jgi:hypothetical protein
VPLLIEVSNHQDAIRASVRNARVCIVPAARANIPGSFVDGVGRPAIGIAFIKGGAEVGIAAVVAGSRTSGSAAIADVASVSISARGRRWLKGNAASGATTAARAARSAYTGRVAAPATKSGLAVENRIVARSANRSTCANGDRKRPRADGLGKLLNDAASARTGI